MLSLELEIAKIPTKKKKQQKNITLAELNAHQGHMCGALNQGHRTKISGAASPIATVAMSLRISYLILYIR